MAASTVLFRNEEDLPRLIEPSGAQGDRLAEASRAPAQFFRMQGSPHDPASRQERVPIPAGEFTLQAGRPGIYLHGSFFELPDQTVSRPPGFPPTDPTDPPQPGKPKEVEAAFTRPTIKGGGQSTATREGIFFNPATGRNEHAVVGGWIVEIVLESLRTFYYKPFHRGTDNPIHGTLGDHEDAHKAFARSWWVMSNLQAIQYRDDIALFWVAWNGALYPDNRQVKHIVDYFEDLHYWEQRRSLDRKHEPFPVFAGQRASAPSHTLP